MWNAARIGAAVGYIMTPIMHAHAGQSSAKRSNPAKIPEGQRLLIVRERLIEMGEYL
jgi:hypothetical protein